MERLCFWCEHLEYQHGGPVCEGAYTWDSGELTCRKRRFKALNGDDPMGHPDLYATVHTTVDCPDYTIKERLVSLFRDKP